MVDPWLFAFMVGLLELCSFYSWLGMRTGTTPGTVPLFDMWHGPRGGILDHTPTELTRLVLWFFCCRYCMRCNYLVLG